MFASRVFRCAARAVPGRASYYVKPKNKKGPSGQAWLALAGVTTTITGLGIYVLGAPEEEIAGLDSKDPYASLHFTKAHLLRARDRIMDFRKSFVDPSSQKLLPDLLPPPYQRPYTLLIELNDLLLYASYDRTRGWTYQKRPDVDTLLMKLFDLYEIVIFTSENAMTAAPQIQALDPNQFFTYHLFRDSTKYIKGHHVKDLTHLNRPLSKVIILDTDSKSVRFHPQNSIILGKWKGDTADSAMRDLIPLLQTIAVNEVDDVRPVLDFYKSAGDDKVLETFSQRQALLQAEEERTMAESRAWKKGVGTAIPTFSFGSLSRRTEQTLSPSNIEVSVQPESPSELSHDQSSWSVTEWIGSWMGWK